MSNKLFYSVIAGAYLVLALLVDDLENDDERQEVSGDRSGDGGDDGDCLPRAEPSVGGDRRLSDDRPRDQRGRFQPQLTGPVIGEQKQLPETADDLTDASHTTDASQSAPSEANAS